MTKALFDTVREVPNIQRSVPPPPLFYSPQCYTAVPVQLRAACITQRGAGTEYCLPENLQSYFRLQERNLIVSIREKGEKNLVTLPY